MRSLRKAVCVGSLGIIALVPPAIADTPQVRSNFERSFFIPAPLDTDTRTPVTAPQPPEKDEAATAAAPTVEPVEPKAAEPKVVLKATTTLAQDQPAPTPESPPATTPASSPAPPPPAPTFGPRIGVRYNSEGAGIQQFVGFETFLPLFQKPAQSISFVEGRALYDPENSTFGGTVLLGYRTFNPAKNRILGGYLAYDNRETGNSFFNQIGAGVESLGDDWDARLNAYFPIANTRNEVGTSFSPGFFQANSLLINRLSLFEAAMTGFDVEYGRKLLSFGQNGSLRGYLGFYLYGGNEGDSAIGGRLRLAARINDYAALGLVVQHDSLFDTRAIVNVALNFPTSAPSEGSTYAPVVTRLGGTVERTPGITVTDQRRRDTVVAINPTTSQPWQFIHVDLGAAGGNGTVESPYGSFTQGLGSASSGNVVYVRSGTNPGLASFTIPQGVQVLSTGPRQFLDTQQLGSVQLPLSGSGVLPIVNGTVTLSSNTGIGGLTINPPASASAIQGTNVSGTIKVTDNVVTGTTGTLTPGIFIDNDSQTMNLELARNQVSNTTGEGIFVRSRGTSNTSGTATANETRNTVGSGIKFFTLDDSKLTATISNNFVTGNTATVGQDGAIRVGTFNNGLVNVNLLSNQLIDNETNGFFIGSEDFSDVRITALNNVTVNNLGIGIFFGARQSSKETGYFAGNYSARNRINPNVDPPGFPTGHGIFIGAQERGENNTTLYNNVIVDNEQNGIFLFVANQGRGTFNVINNVSSNNRRNGIEFNVGLNPDPPPPNPIILPPPPVGTLQGVANISNNTVNDNAGQGPVGQEGGGIIVIGANNALLQTTIQGNFVNSNAAFRAPGQAGFAGIGMVSLDNSQIQATVRFNTILNTAAPSFNAQTAPGSTSKICLKLNFNSADAGNLAQGGPYPLIVGRSSGATFQADTSGNSGPPVIESGLTVSVLGNCPVPP